MLSSEFAYTSCSFDILVLQKQDFEREISLHSGRAMKRKWFIWNVRSQRAQWGESSVARNVLFMIPNS